MRGKIVLSARLGAIAAMVTKGNRVCDIGCDHGFMPIYLLQQGISPSALAMDVREGPLGQARIHIQECALEALIETRLSDGLSAFREGEADTLICAGMGGKLMMRILSEAEEKAASFRELILQPQSEVQQFRSFLRGQGYLLKDENMIEEDGKFYPMMKAEKGRMVPMILLELYHQGIVLAFFGSRWKTVMVPCCCKKSIQCCIGIWSGKCVSVMRCWSNCWSMKRKIREIETEKAGVMKKSADKSRTV